MIDVRNRSKKDLEHEQSRHVACDVLGLVLEIAELVV
jgi:hypothetical protein